MDNFNKLPKMQCFKEGGTVQREVKNFTKRDRKTMDSADIAQDKAIVKKAIGMHDKQEHKGEKTDLSKLKKGGRAKCSGGTVNRYKAGGAVGVYGAKKSSGDLDSIEKAKDIKPTKAAAPSKAATKPAFKGSDVAKEKGKPSGDAIEIIKSKQSGKAAAAASGAGGPDAYKKGGKVKKYSGATGSSVAMTPLEKRRQMEKMARAQKYLGPAQQSELINQSPAAAGLTPPTPAPAPAPAPTGMPMQKRGGKVKKGC
jgi:hypothetical protein